MFNICFFFLLCAWYLSGIFVSTILIDIFLTYTYGKYNSDYWLSAAAAVVDVVVGRIEFIWISDDAVECRYGGRFPLSLILQFMWLREQHFCKSAHVQHKPFR